LETIIGDNPINKLKVNAINLNAVRGTGEVLALVWKPLLISVGRERRMEML